MKKNINLYIIIVTYNAMPWIRQCLESCLSFKVIVVDNNSEDGTQFFIKNSFPEVIVLSQDINNGFGKANNIGVSYALKNGAEQVFLLNQDAYLSKNTIEVLYHKFQKNEEYGILSPIHLNGLGDKLDRDFCHYISYEFNTEIVSDYMLDKEKEEIYDVPFINAAGWMISKKCLEEVGGFDPLFFHYGEDDNYCQRVLFHKFKIGIVPGVFLRHDREESFDKLNPLRDDLEIRQERQWKIYFGNINKEMDKELTRFISNKRKSWVRTSLKLHSAAKIYKREYNLLLKIKPEIVRSRTINKQKGSHYLTV